ncbi:MAG: hypothetical protein Tsb0015_17180 [Simkaniaceae bacterium]
MRFLSTIVFLGIVGYGLWWVNEKHPEWKSKAMEFIQTGEFATLEVRFTPEQVLEENKRILLKGNKHKYLEPELKFYPYLLMEVKYSLSQEKTGEGIILWDLIDGEMVTDTHHWEKTHGFGDCINAKAGKSEFQIIQAIAKHGGFVDEETLARMTKMEKNSFYTWLNSCRRKKLIVQHGKSYRLHMQNPRLNILPETVISDRIVTKAMTQSPRIPSRYSIREIKRTASYAFGDDFAVRTTREVFLPVYRITVQNPDNTLHTSYFNALNGRQILSQSFIE